MNIDPDQLESMPSDCRPFDGINRADAIPKPLELTMPGIEKLTRAKFVSPSTIELDFVDGRRLSLAIEALGMPLDRIDWPTLEASPCGGKAVVRGIKGDLVPIDSATLRYLVDEKYAAKVDDSLKALQFSREELALMARDNPPPANWYDEPEQDLTRESWK